MRHPALLSRVGTCLAVAAAVAGWHGVAQASPLWVSCKPVEAGVFGDRIHVKCSSPVDDRFWYFAAPLTDARFATRALSVIEVAQVGDKVVNVLFDPADQSGAGFGCLNADCRRIMAVVMVELPILPPSPCAFDTNRPSCPGYCAAHDDLTCAGFCTRHPTEVGCPHYCSAHPDDPDCPGYCKRHPHDTINCEPTGLPAVCSKKPYLPQCNPNP